VINRLKRLSKAGADLRKPLSECGEIMRRSIEQNFQQGGRFSSPNDWRGGGNRWADLSPVTIELRKKENKWPGKKLIKSAELKNSISAVVKGNELEVGTNLEYAAIQHYGGQAGRNHKVTIPARPFLVVQDEDIENMVDVLDKHISKQ
jgi:phage virion morphogenesis protein